MVLNIYDTYFTNKRIYTAKWGQNHTLLTTKILGRLLCTRKPENLLFLDQVSVSMRGDSLTIAKVTMPICCVVPQNISLHDVIKSLKLEIFEVYLFWLLVVPISCIHDNKISTRNTFMHTCTELSRNLKLELKLEIAAAPAEFISQKISLNFIVFCKKEGNIMHCTRILDKNK